MVCNKKKKSSNLKKRRRERSNSFDNYSSKKRSWLKSKTLHKNIKVFDKIIEKKVKLELKEISNPLVKCKNIFSLSRRGRNRPDK